MVRDRWRVAWGAWLLASVLATGCDDERVPGSTVSAEIEEADLDVMWVGCVLLDEGRGCQRTRRPLRVWVSEQDASRRWTISGRATRPTEERVDGGTRFHFEGDRFDRGELVLWAADRATPILTLDLVPNATARENFDFGQASAELPDVASKRAAAEALLAEPSASDVERLARVRYARLLSYDRGGSDETAAVMLPLIEEEARLAAQQGRWAERCQAALVGLHWGTMLRREELHRRWGALEDECRGRGAYVGARFDYYLGESALFHGTYAEAEARLAHNRLVLERLLPERASYTASKQLELYVRTGRWTEAQRELEEREAVELSECGVAERRSDTGFVRLRALQTGEADLGNPRPELVLALEAHSRGPCRNDALRVHDLAKLGFDAVVRRDADALRQTVEGLDKESVFGKYIQQTAELKLALAVLEERFDDVPELASRMAALMEQGEPEARWRHHMLMAEAAQGRGDSEAVELAYRSAEAVLDEAWGGVDSGAVRARWLAAYRASALGLMNQRLAAGDPEAAACAARSARLRALEVPLWGGTANARCDRPWSRKPDEVVFLIVPETDAEWHVFVLENERVVEAARVAPPSGAEAEGGWWDRWSPALETADRVRILASGTALEPALHELHWGDAPLIAQRPVTFGLDLEPSDPLRTAATGDTSVAAVVFSDGDPLRTLGRYADEVRTTTSVLEGQGWSVRWANTPDRPGMAATVAAADLLVYYGHGQRVGAASLTDLKHTRDVGSTALLLRDGQLWGADEVAALADPPRRAVLLGCQVGFSDPQSWSGGLNLAHALLLAGTQEVLAASEPLDAAVAAKVAASFFEGGTPTDAGLPHALHSAWAGAPLRAAEAPWRALRVWSR